MRNRLFILFSFLIFSSAILAQGTLRGTLLDGISGETMPFANILIKETGTGNTTDLDGTYAIPLDAGAYTVEFSFIGYATLTISEVVITDGEVTILDGTLQEETELLGEIVVTATQIKNTETAVLAIQKKAPGMLDGISKQAIKRAGDSDVGSAVKRVTGVSVEDGKYVVVRGLGDRYSKTILNGMDVPGLDPDRNSVQLDIFPTNLVDNLIVYKSFTPDLPADFTGGLINVITKDFPDTKTLSASVGVSYNPSMHFNDKYVTSASGGMDWLGMDDGLRKMPNLVRHIQTESSLEFPNRTQPNERANLADLMSRFDNTFGTMIQNSGMDHNYSLSYGNQINKSNVDIGYTVSANYRNETEFLDDAQFNVYLKNRFDADETALNQEVFNNVDRGTNNVLWSALAGAAIKTGKSKISLSAMRSQNGVNKSANIDRSDFENESLLSRQVIEYTERSVTNFLLAGKHSFGDDNNLTLNWKASPTFSKLEDPDIRQASYQINEDNGNILEINPSAGATVTRTWRAMDERNYSGQVNAALDLAVHEGLKSKIKVGFSGVYKTRDFRIDNFNFRLHRATTFDFTGDPAELFTPEVLYGRDNDRGLYVEGGTVLSNIYDANQQVLAGYAMHEHPFSKKFKAIYGVRVEKVDQRYTGQRQIVNDPTQDIFNNRNVLNETNILPSIGLMYQLSENEDNGSLMNLRGSYNQTLARPSFKEKSIAQIEDRISGRTFIGNIDLDQSNISNYDLRWEYFLPAGQMLSVSTFYKSFDKPIELTAFDATSPTTFTPRNVGDASIAGIEFELRKNFGFLNESLGGLSLLLNATVVKSEVEMTVQEIAGREQSTRTGEEIGTTRDMVGQSPYIINAGLIYKNADQGWESNLAYNVQGERLAIAGIGLVSDVYDQPFNSLNFKISKSIGTDRRWKASFSAGNILGAKRQQFYKSFQAEDQIFETFSPGRTFGFSLGYSL